MNEELLKKIAQYVRVKGEIPKEIKGYEDDVVKNIVQDMFDKDVIHYGKVFQNSPSIGNYEIREGKSVSIEKQDITERLIFSEFKFKDIYGITWY